MSNHYDLIDLKLFVCIAEENSLTRGASKAHMSLPAASLRIKNLEQSFGIKLFDRTHQGLTLRAAGQAFLRHARQVINQLDNLGEEMQEYVKGLKGHLRVLVSTTAVTEFLPSIVRTFLIEHPDINIDLREKLSIDILQAVASGATDIGIVAGNVGSDSLQVIPYRSDRLVLVTALRHPLAGTSPVCFGDTLHYDYIGLYEGSAIHSFLHQAAANLHKKIPIRVQVRSFEAVCSMVEANIGIGIVPEIAARRYAKNMSIQVMPLSDEWALRNLLICVRDMTSLPSFAKEFIDLLIEDANENGSGMRQTRIEFS